MILENIFKFGQIWTNNLPEHCFYSLKTLYLHISQHAIRKIEKAFNIIDIT